MGDPKQNPARRKSGGVGLGIVQDDPQRLQPKEEGLLLGLLPSSLHSSQGYIRTKRRSLGRLFSQLLSRLVQFSKLCLNQLGHFLSSTGRDFVHSARVSNRLLGSRLTERSVQRSCFLRGLQAHHGLGILGAILDRVTGSTQVQGSH